MEKPRMTSVEYQFHYRMMETQSLLAHTKMMAMAASLATPEFTPGMAQLGANLVAILMVKPRMTKVAFLFR